MSSKLNTVEYHQVLQQVTSWIIARSKSPNAQNEARLFIETIDRRTNTKDELIDQINMKLQRLQNRPAASTESSKWILEKKDVLQNVLTKFESKRQLDSSFENSLSNVAREGFASLKKMLSLNLQPDTDMQQYADDIMRIKRSLAELRDYSKDRNQEALYHEEESLLYIFLTELLILLEIIKEDHSKGKEIFASGRLDTMKTTLQAWHDKHTKIITTPNGITRPASTTPSTDSLFVSNETEKTLDPLPRGSVTRMNALTRLLTDLPGRYDQLANSSKDKESLSLSELLTSLIVMIQDMRLFEKTTLLTSKLNAASAASAKKRPLDQSNSSSISASAPNKQQTLKLMTAYLAKLYPAPVDHNSRSAGEEHFPLVTKRAVEYLDTSDVYDTRESVWLKKSCLASSSGSSVSFEVPKELQRVRFGGMIPPQSDYTTFLS